MAKRKASWDILSESEKQTCLDSLIRHFQVERDEQIGVIAAEQILDCVLQQVVSAAYNKSLDDTKELIIEKMGDLSVDIDLLKQ